MIFGSPDLREDRGSGGDDKMNLHLACMQTAACNKPIK